MPRRRLPCSTGATLLLNTGSAGVCLVPRGAWSGRAGLRAAADLNAVPPLGIEGIEVTDDAVDRQGVTTFGALGVGGLKMKIHKACIARLFERNDLVLDAETIADLAREMAKPRDSGVSRDAAIAHWNVAGRPEERRILPLAANHCADCLNPCGQSQGKGTEK